MVRKKNDDWRFCLDFLDLNGVTVKDAYPLSNMTNILDTLGSAHYITSLDLSQAYFQVPLEKKSREYTAFAVPQMGLFHFKRMPFGLCNASATFQRLLNRVIGPEMVPCVFAYLDDIIIATETLEEHRYWLRRVLLALTEAGLAINPRISASSAYPKFATWDTC